MSLPFFNLSDYCLYLPRRKGSVVLAGVLDVIERGLVDDTQEAQQALLMFFFHTRFSSRKALRDTRGLGLSVTLGCVCNLVP